MMIDLPVDIFRY